MKYGNGLGRTGQTKIVTVIESHPVHFPEPKEEFASATDHLIVERGTGPLFKDHLSHVGRIHGNPPDAFDEHFRSAMLR